VNDTDGITKNLRTIFERYFVGRLRPRVIHIGSGSGYTKASRYYFST